MSRVILGIDIENLLNARKNFELFRKDMHSDRDKAGAIQAFECTYELAWKTMKRVLAKQGIDVASPRNCIREAALNSLISDPKVWFSCLDVRNAASHTYDQDNVDAVLKNFEPFSQALQEFITNLEQL